MTQQAVNQLTGVVVALCAEANCLTNSSVPVATPFRHRNLLIYVAGMGAENASHAAQVLIDAGCQRLLSWGTAGALMTNLRSGDLLIPTYVINAEGCHLETHTEWREKFVSLINRPAQSGPLLSSPEVLSTATRKQQAQQNSDAIAVDMESAAIARLAIQHSIPFMTIRTVVDTAEMSVPDYALQTIDRYGRSRPLKTLCAIARHPTSLAALIKLGSAFKQALRTLKDIAPVLTPEDTVHASV